MAKAGDRKARLARTAVQSLDRYISATQLGITLASLGLGWIGEPALAHVIEGAFAWLPQAAAMIATHAVASIIAFIIITVSTSSWASWCPRRWRCCIPSR